MLCPPPPPDGTIQFAFQPVLDSIAVTAPQASLANGGREQLMATATISVVSGGVTGTLTVTVTR